MPRICSHFYLFFLCLLFGLESIDAQEKRTLVVNIFSDNNGKGLENSRKILKKAIENLGHTVVNKNLSDHVKENEPFVDVNIYFQIVKTQFYSYASHNWFIPNPEYFIQSQSVLNGIDLILCRTHEVERIFKKLNKETYYLGFTSSDCYQDDITKNFARYLHVAGGSPHKGTKAIISAWKKSYFPLLTVIKFSGRDPLNQFNLQWIRKRLPVDDLRFFQNTCGVHLCPSEVEGYGHYIMEALSTGAVVVTTDAPPMNEFVTDKNCLVSYTHTSTRWLGTEYFVDPDDLKSKISKITSMSKSKLKKIGENNRQIYLQKTQEFQENLGKLFDSIN